MGNAAVEAAAVGRSMTPDLSIWALFIEADVIIKLVLLILVLASFWCWAIIFEKVLRFRRLRQRATEFEASFWSGGSLEDLYDRISGRPADPMSSIFTAAMREWRRSTERGPINGDPKAGLAERIDRVMEITLGREMEHLERYMTFLASVGSTAPFLGLFGTVWGIMNTTSRTSITSTMGVTLISLTSLGRR